MRRSSYAATVLAGGVAVMVGLFLLARSETGRYGERAGTVANPQTVEQAGGGAGVIPQGQPYPAQRPLPQQPVNPGSLQLGVDGSQAVTHLEEESASDIPDYTEHELHAKAGEVVTLTFRNTSDPALAYRHTWVLVKPGTENDVMLAAEKAGGERSWIPDSPDVLAHTDIVLPGQSETIAFRVPSEPGDYPFICTFPGHGLKMRGILHVTQSGS